MRVLICHTSDFSRTVVLEDDRVVLDRMLDETLLDEQDLLAAYQRAGAQVTIATLPKGAQMIYG